eukprot:scaffold14429_cov62-Phaeocystis_antarctica.AAC.1
MRRVRAPACTGTIRASRRATRWFCSTDTVSWLTAADMSAATRHSRSPASCSGLLSGPERRALAAWVPERGRCGALVPA